MNPKTISAMAIGLCATQLSAQSAPAPHSAGDVMAGHGTPGTLVTMSEWTRRMHRVLVRELRYPAPILGMRAASGTVRVKFNCSDSGGPDKVSLLKTSGSLMLDRAALTAVRRMASLHPLPNGFTPAQKFEAIVVFANDSSDVRVANTEDEATSRNEWYHDPLTASATSGRFPIDARLASAR